MGKNTCDFQGQLTWFGKLNNHEGGGVLLRNPDSVKGHRVIPFMSEICLKFHNIVYSFICALVPIINKFLLCCTIQFSTQVLEIFLFFS